jgi:energy-coupling factor transport system substrate-specific component
MKKIFALCLMAIMGVVLAASKEALAFLPNFELVTLLLILFTLCFGRYVIGALGVFLLLEGLLYGFGLWWAMYLYVWPLLAGLAWLFRWMDRAWQWALLAGGYGLCFGSLCALAYLPLGGASMALAWAIAGLPFDFIHAGANFLLALVLYRPLRTALDRLPSIT